MADKRIFDLCVKNARDPKSKWQRIGHLFEKDREDGSTNITGVINDFPNWWLVSEQKFFSVFEKDAKNKEPEEDK